MDWKFIISRPVCDILIGDHILMTGVDSAPLHLPYLKIYNIPEIATEIGLPSTIDWNSLPNSRSSRMMTLLTEAIQYNKVVEVINIIFNKRRFSGIVSAFSSNSKFNDYYNNVITDTIEKINKIAYLENKHLEWSNGRISIMDVDKSAIFNHFDKEIDSAYIKNLSVRIQDDLRNENFDSVITKCRTLVEELCIFIIERKNVSPKLDGKLNNLWKQTKILLNMNDVNDFDKRIADLISGLNKIVDAITSLRNINSDSHGVGCKRINIGKREANLIANSTIVFCEYIYDVYSQQTMSKL